MRNYLDFETEIKILDQELDKLKDPFSSELTEVNTNKIIELENEINEKLKKIYANLDAWQTVQVARAEDRPTSKYYVENLFSNFVALSGDRSSGLDKSIITGIATFEGKSVMIIAQERGYDLDSRIEANFGMTSPSGYRTAIRCMKLANKFNIPCIFFVDTNGADPSVKSESQGQAAAIAKSINICLSLKVPTITLIHGVGGSGGAVALAATNKTIMMQHSIYSVISPEGAAKILFRDEKKNKEAAKAMKLTSKDLLELKVIDEIIPEPLPAHVDRDLVLSNVRDSIRKNLDELSILTKDEIYSQKKLKFLSIGRDEKFKYNTENLLSMTSEEKSIFNWDSKFFKDNNKYILILVILFFSFIIYYLL